MADPYATQDRAAIEFDSGLRAQIGRWKWILASAWWAFGQSRRGRILVARDMTNEQVIELIRRNRA